MRILPLVLLAALPQITACATQEDITDLGSVADGKSDAPAVEDVPVTIPKFSTTGHPGVRNFSVRSTLDFEVSLAYDTDNDSKITVTNLDTGETFESDTTKQPEVTVTASTGEAEYKIRLENHTPTTLHAKLSALGENTTVSADIVAAARANLDRITKEIDYNHLKNYGLSGSLTDQFMTAVSQEYEHQHPDIYEARMKALASMVFFAMPDVLPPADGHTTPFHGLDMDQFDTLASIEDQIFSALVAQNNHDTNGVRPFSVCETKYIIETYVRPHVAFPGFDAHKAGYATYADTCPQKDKDEWYNFRGLGGLRPSWVESNLSDRFLRRMAKYCQHPSSSFTDECKLWDADRFGYRQLRNRQLAARTIYYAPEDESYLTNPNNSLVLLEDRNGDGIGEYFRPGPATLVDGTTGTLQVNSTGQFTGNLKFDDGSGNVHTVAPQDIQAIETANPLWDPALLNDKDMGLTSVFADPAGCTSASIDPDQCPLMKRFYSMIDRHENFYRTYSALSPTYYGISSQPSPLVACSITLEAAHAWDTAGTPSGGRAGFIFLMRIPFEDILTGNDTSVATLMPGPKTTSIQSLYDGAGGSLDMSSLWLDVASLSNNQYSNEHEISAFGAVKPEQIEGILVIRKPAAVQ